MVHLFVIHDNMLTTFISVIKQSFKAWASCLCNRFSFLNPNPQLTDCATPVAWKAGIPFGIIVDCTLDNLVSLILAFQDGYLQLEDMLEIKVLSSKF